MTTSTGILAILALAFAPWNDAAAQARIQNLDQRDLQLAMARLATEHPALVTVVPVGESRKARRIEALRVAAGELVPGRPALLIVANIDGPLTWTSALAVDHVRELVARYGSDARVKALLDTTTLYVIPRVDADAAEARFATPLFEETASGPGVDDDRDGRQGEDPPADIDGDARILWMRVPDPLGEWTTDPLDARSSIKADRAKGQRGTFKLVREGRDADKDESASEDQELDTVLNRNFPQGWAEHGPASGRFATDEPGTRALCEFVLLHKDISIVLTYGMQDNVIDKVKAESKSTARSSPNPSDGIPESDAAVLTELGKRFTKVGQAAKGDGKDAGTFQAWIQAQRGLWAVNVCPWSIPLAEGDAKTESDAKKDGDAKKEGDAADSKKEGDDAAPKKEGEGKPGKKKGEDKDTPSDDIKRLRWMDAKSEGARFVPWKKFQHPELGEVEIGGFAPYALVEPPEADRTEIATKNVEAVLQLAEFLPRVRLVDVKAKDKGGLWEVEAALVNDSQLPLVSALGLRAGIVRPVRVMLVLPAGATILGGNKQELVRELNGSGSRKEFRWLVKGAAPSAMKIAVDSDYAGSTSATPEVK